MSRVVWVLGSGFSKPLGGPTLDELFSARAHHELEAIYTSDGPLSEARKKVLGGNTVLARRVYLLGCSRSNEPQLIAHDETLRGRLGYYWGDAEEFLDLLETAAQAPEDALARMLGRLVGVLTSQQQQGSVAQQIRGLRDGARRLLAVECSKFLVHANPASERWEPYQEFRKVLRDKDPRNQHTIITFNYDTVLETLHFRDWVRLPGHAGGEGHCVLKLHGSVDWKREGNGFSDVEDNPHFAAGCEDAELAIAPPGPDKSKIAADFEDLWKTAEERLRAAHVVFFIGYRFPPTDSTARRRILGAINTRSELNIILGPNTAHADIARLEGMLRFKTPDARIRVHPMWSQDFLSVFPTGLLHPPWLGE